MRSLIVLTIAGVLSCSEPPPPEPVAPPEVQVAAPPDVQAATAPQAPIGQPAAPVAEPPAGPQATYDPVVGWLAFAPGADPEGPWTPRDTAGKIVILEPQGWEGVAADTVFDVVTAKGRSQLNFDATGDVLIGCDGGHATPAASFLSESSIPGGLVWVLPHGAAPEAKPLVLNKRPGKKAGRTAWRAGAMVVVLEKTGTITGDLVVRVGNKELLREGFEKYTMMDDEAPEPLTLDSSYEVAVPQPVAAWLIDGDTRVIVTQRYSFEGVHHDVLLVTGSEARKVGGLGTYLCAF